MGTSTKAGSSDRGVGGEMPSALQLGTVDAVVIYGLPRQQVKDTLHTREVMNMGARDYENFAEAGWVTTQDVIDKYPTAIADFQCAMMESTQLMIDDPSTYSSVTAKYLGIDPKKVQALGPVNWIPKTRIDKFSQISDIMKRVGMLQQDDKFDIKSIIVPLAESCNQSGNRAI